MELRVKTGYYQTESDAPGFGISDDDVTFFALPGGGRKFLTDNLDRNPFTQAVPVAAVAEGDELSKMSLVVPYDGTVLRVSILPSETITLTPSDPGPLSGREWQLVKTADDTVIASGIFTGDTEEGGNELTAGFQYDLVIEEADVTKGEALTINVLAVDSMTTALAVPESFIVIDWLDPEGPDVLYADIHEFTPAGRGYIDPGGGGYGPVFSSFSPSHAKVGDQIALGGSGFLGQQGVFGPVNTVTFDGQASGSFQPASFRVVNDSEIIVTVPAGAATGGHIRLHSQGTTGDVITVSSGTFTLDAGTGGGGDGVGPSLSLTLEKPSISGGDLQSLSSIVASEKMQKLVYELNIGQAGQDDGNFIIHAGTSGALLLPGKAKDVAINTGITKIGGSKPPNLFHQAEIQVSAEFKGGVVIKKRKAVQVKLPYTEGRLIRDHALYQIWISPPYPTWARGKDWNITDFTMAECTVVVKKGTLMGGSWVWFMGEMGNQSMISPVVTLKYGTKGTMAWLRAKSQNGGSLADWGCGIRSGTIRILPPEGPAEEFSLQTNPTVQSLIQARWKSANADGQWTI